MPPYTDAEDTIVVKGTYGWSNPTSPIPIEAPQKPPLAGIHSLATSNDIPNLESPEPNFPIGKSPLQPDNTPRARASPGRGTPSNIKKPTQNAATMEERLQAMPEKRSLPWRAGVEPGAEVETGGDSRRKQIRFGCLLATRGDVAPIPCVSCANGRGKFNVCVALEGFFKGACASCQLSGRPNKCSIKQSDDALPSPKTETPKAKPEAVNEPQRTSSATLPSSGPPSSKRRRVNDILQWENSRPQWEHELGDSQARQQMKDISQNQRPWATVNASTPPATVPQKVRDWGSDTLPRAAMGWAAVNQIVPAPIPSQIPPPLIPDNTRTSIPEHNVNGARGRPEPERKEEDTRIKVNSPALIDMLPKTKQRQVYGLVSGLQGGIEHLQRELDSLKKALGIDDDT